MSSRVAFTKLSQKTALLTAADVVSKLRSYVAHTITFDNDVETTQHGLIAEALGIAVYFADPLLQLAARRQ